MTVTATYMNDLSRVRVAYSSAPAGTDYAKVERSLDGITWVTVRGGAQVTTITSAGKVDDYEFTPGVVNTYRVSYVDTALLPTFGTAGTAATGNNASVVPAHPASLAIGELKLIFASIRNSGAGTVNTPAGWAKIAESGNMALLSRVHQSGDTAPTVTFTGGVVNADTLAQMARFPNSKALVSSAPVSQLNGSAQNIAGPTVVLDGGGMLLYLGWKQDDMTSSTTPSFATKIGDVSSTTGDDASMCWFYFASPTANAGVSFTVWPVVITGGAAAISRGMAVQIPVVDNIGVETQTVTPSLQDVTGVEKVWIKNLQRPYMNTALSTPVGLITVKRAARAGVFPVVGRSVAVAVTDQRLGKELTLGARVESANERDRLELVLKSGEPILLHIPPGIIRLKSMYAVIGDDEYDDETVTYTLPLTEVAAPDASIVGNTVTWTDVVATYATWADLIAAKATWAAVLDSVGSPTDVITG